MALDAAGRAVAPADLDRHVVPVVTLGRGPPAALTDQVRILGLEARRSAGPIRARAPPRPRRSRSSSGRGVADGAGLDGGLDGDGSRRRRGRRAGAEREQEADEHAQAGR